MTANGTTTTETAIVPGYLQSRYVVDWAKSHSMDSVNFGILIGCTAVHGVLLIPLLVAICRTSRTVMRPIILSQLSLSYLMFFISLLVSVNRSAMSLQTCNSIANLMVYSVLATIVWSTIDPLSIYITGSKQGPRFKHIYYTLIGWGFPLLLMIIFVIVNSVKKIPLYHQDRCMVDLEDNLFSLVVPVGVMFVANIIAFGVMLKFSTEKEYSALSMQLQIKSCRLMFIVLTLPMYITTGVIFSIYSLSDYPLYLEYIAAALYMLITLLAVITMLMIDPTVKNSLLHAAKEKYEEIKALPKVEVKPAAMYIP